MVAVAHKGIKTRTTDVLFTCPIFLSTGEIKSMPASSKEKIVNEKWKIHTELDLRKYQGYLVGTVVLQLTISSVITNPLRERLLTLLLQS